MSTWTFDNSHSMVGFSARHMMISTVRGRFEDFDGTLEDAARQAHLSRQPCAFATDWILHDLNQHRVALVDQALDRRRLVLRELPVLPDVGHVQECRPLEPDVDEGRLHARQHARDATEKDGADQPAHRDALDLQLLHDASIEDRDPRLLRGDVYQYVFHLRRECTQGRASPGLARGLSPVRFSRGENRKH